jgi:hypothetical protein
MKLTRDTLRNLIRESLKDMILEAEDTGYDTGDTGLYEPGDKLEWDPAFEDALDAVGEGGKFWWRGKEYVVKYPESDPESDPCTEEREKQVRISIGLMTLAEYDEFIIPKAGFQMFNLTSMGGPFQSIPGFAPRDELMKNIEPDGIEKLAKFYTSKEWLDEFKNQSENPWHRVQDTILQGIEIFHNTGNRDELEAVLADFLQLEYYIAKVCAGDIDIPAKILQR